MELRKGEHARYRSCDTGQGRTDVPEYPEQLCDSDILFWRRPESCWNLRRSGETHEELWSGHLQQVRANDVKDTKAIECFTELLINSFRSMI